MNVDSFDYQGYRALITRLLATRTNLCFRDFLGDRTEKEYLILRHDIDYSTDAALKMAEFENGIGVRATYFLLFSSRFYNLLDASNIDVPKKLFALGHEVGLHYDIGVIQRADEKGDGKSVFSRQVDLLSSLVGEEVVSVAMHNPSTSGSDIFRNEGFVNAYSNRFVRDIGYFSDSGGAWRDNFVQCFQNNSFPERMQLLIHPLFWRDASIDRWRILDEFVQSRTVSIAEGGNEAKKLWAEHAGVREHDERQKLNRMWTQE